MRRYVDWFSIHRPKVSLRAYPHRRLPHARTAAGIGQSGAVVFLPSLAPYKGLEILLEAYRSLLPLYPCLTIDHRRHRTSSLSRVRRVACGMSIGSLPGVSWPGQVPEEQVQALFSRAQIVVLPYTASTGSSSVMYQSAMWGRAMVASDLPEIRSVADESGLEIEFFKNRDVSRIGEGYPTPARFTRLDAKLSVDAKLPRHSNHTARKKPLAFTFRPSTRRWRRTTDPSAFRFPGRSRWSQADDASGPPGRPPGFCSARRINPDGALPPQL